MTTSTAYTATIAATISCTYTVELSKATAKAIAAETVDPNESWEDQAESVIESSLEYLLEDPLAENLIGCLPQTIDTVMEGKKVKLALSVDDTCVEIDMPEVQ